MSQFASDLEGETQAPADRLSSTPGGGKEGILSQFQHAFDPESRREPGAIRANDSEPSWMPGRPRNFTCHYPPTHHLTPPPPPPLTQVGCVSYHSKIMQVGSSTKSRQLSSISVTQMTGLSLSPSPLLLSPSPLLQMPGEYKESRAALFDLWGKDTGMQLFFPSFSSPPPLPLSSLSSPFACGLPKASADEDVEGKA